MKTWFLPLVLVTLACGNPAGEAFDIMDLIAAGTGVQPGIVKFYDSIDIRVPGTAAVGESVTIAVVTWGGGCVSKAETVVTTSGLSVLVEPMDRVTDPGPRGACTEQLLGFDHEATVVFDQTGDATVEIRGRAWPENEPYSSRHTITVR